jgi:hypothetical protein
MVSGFSLSDYFAEYFRKGTDLSELHKRSADPVPVKERVCSRNSMRYVPLL